MALAKTLFYDELPAAHFRLTDKERAASTYANEEAKRDAQLDKWVAEAETKSASADAQEQWVLYRGKRYLFSLLNGMPSTMEADGERASYVISQINNYRDEAAGHYAAYERAANVQARKLPRRRVGTGTVSATPNWDRLGPHR